MSVQHRPRVLAHGCDAFGVRGQAHERLGKRVGAGFDDEAARVLFDEPRDFAILRGNCDHRPTSSRDAVKLARDDETFELGPQRYPMHIRNAERVFQQRLILIGEESKQVLEATLPNRLGEFRWRDPHQHNRGLLVAVKRGIMGSFHKVSRKCLPLYVAEFQFRYNNRDNVDIFGTAIAGC
jgi:hypothetical protein